MNAALESSAEDATSVDRLPDPSWKGPRCSKCQAPQRSEGMTACTECGWYASLGIYVEVSREWEEAATGTAPAAAPKSPLMAVLGLLPPWGWWLLATQILVIGGSIAVRMSVDPEGDFRTIWAVSQVLGGIALAVVCHVVSFVLVATEDTQLGPLDLVVNPFRAWTKLCYALPRRFWLLDLVVSSVVASIAAAAIIGGIPYDRLWDWNIQAPVKQNLVAAIAAKATGKPQESALDKAMKKFAEDAGVDGYGDLPNLDDLKLSKDFKPKPIDGLIVGYTTGDNGRIDELIIVTEHRKKLIYAGRITPKMPVEELDALQLRFQANSAPKPFVTVLGNANWVKPKFPCRLTYLKRVESGMLQGLVWKGLLRELRLPWE